jgi:hypothetical protein
MIDHIIFLHIEKTGGTTLGVPLRLLYGYSQSFQATQRYDDGTPEAFLELSSDRRRNIRLIKGHTFFGFHEYCPRTSAYFTFLRNPVQRIDSFHRMLQREWPDSEAGSMSLEQFVHSDHPVYVRNGQVRRVVGITDSGAAVTAQDLEQAKRNLERHFILAGITSHFDESLMLLRRRLNWTFPPFYVRSRVGSSSKKNKLSSDLVATIQEQNRWDCELFRYARDRLIEQIKQEGPDFQREVERFRTMNRWFGHVATPAIQLFRSVRGWAKEQGIVHLR